MNPMPKRKPASSGANSATPVAGWSIERAAVEVGKSAQAVRYRVGRHPFSRTADGNLDPARFVAEWATLRDGASTGRPPSTPRRGLHASGPTDTTAQSLADRQMRAKVTSEVERSRMATLRRKRAEGKTCDVDETSRFFSELLVAMRDRTLALAASKASEGAARLGCDAAALEIWLDEVLREHCRGMTAENLEQAARFRTERGGHDG